MSSSVLDLPQTPTNPSPIRMRNSLIVCACVPHYTRSDSQYFSQFSSNKLYSRCSAELWASSVLHITSSVSTCAYWLDYCLSFSDIRDCYLPCGPMTGHKSKAWPETEPQMAIVNYILWKIRLIPECVITTTIIIIDCSGCVLCITYLWNDDWKLFASNGRPRMWIGGDYSDTLPKAPFRIDIHNK